MANPPGSLSLEQELQAIKKRLDEHSQRKLVLPACRVRLASNAYLPSGADTFAQAGWIATEDAYGLYTPGSTNVPGFITIQHAGFYHLHYHSSAIGPPVTAGQNPHIAAAKVTLNSTATATNTIATGSAAYTAYGSDGAVLDAVRDRIPLTVGDRVYWSNWTSANADLQAAPFGVPTELSLRYLSSR